MSPPSSQVAPVLGVDYSQSVCPLETNFYPWFIKRSLFNRFAVLVVLAIKNIAKHVGEA